MIRTTGLVLVVDTVGFLPNRVGFAWSPRKRLVERLTLTEDRRHIAYGFTLEDPGYLLEPVSFDLHQDARRLSPRHDVLTKRCLLVEPKP